MPKKDKLSPAEIEREYGFAYSFFKSDDELWELLQKAIKGDWSADRFAAKLKDTKWFQKHSDIWRQNTALKYSDPETYNERLTNTRTQVQNLAGQFGISLTKAELDRFTQRAFLFGWSPEQIMDKLAPKVTPGSGGHYGGDLSSIEEQLRKTARANGVQLNQGQLTNWMRAIVRGDAGVNQFETYIRDVAAKTFEAYGDQIKGGMDAMDIAAPYLQSMSQILEINPNSLDLTDKTIRKALSYRNDKGEAVPMSITDFEDNLRKDKRWQYTDNARDTMRGYAVNLAKLWGLG